MAEEISKKTEKNELEELLEDFEAKLTTDDNLREDKKSKLMEGLKNSLRTYCYFPNWLNDKELEKYNQDKKTLFSVLIDKVTEINSMAMDDSEIKNSPIELICKKICHLFLCVDFGKPLDEIRDQLQKNKDFVQQCEHREYITKLYSEGFFYLFNGLEALALTQVPANETLLEELEILISKMKGYTDMSQPSQSVVIAVKQNFIGQFDREAYSTQLGILEQVLTLDVNPEYLLWVYQIWRYKRKANWEGRKPPGIEEIGAIVDAVKRFPDHPHVVMAFCNVIAESVKDKDVLYLPITIGTLSFHNIDDVIDFLHSETRRVLSLDPMSVFTNITTAEIYQSILHKKFRNMSFAKMCIERALLFHPNSSKANVRMGMFFLTNKEFGDATKYFEYALQSDPRNFPSFIELMSIYLGNVRVNKQKIMDQLKISSSAAYWNNEKIGRMDWFEGMFHYACLDDQKAIDSWVRAYLNHRDSIKPFKRVAYHVHRYGWDASMFTLKQIKFRIDCVVGTKPMDARTESVIQKIFNVLNEGLEEERAYFSERGRRGHGRGWSGSRGGDGFGRGGSGWDKGGFRGKGGWGDGQRSWDDGQKRSREIPKTT